MVNDIEIKTTKELQPLFKMLKGETTTITVTQTEPANIHPETGIPQIEFDQFKGIATHHQQ